MNCDRSITRYYLLCSNIIMWVYYYVVILGWSESSFGLFHMMLWENVNELFGRPNTFN